jgi:flavin reductase (DIM6/NTAB) family NADH-FMN oxidoreductase RutF
MVLECRLAHTFELGSHTQFVGEIVDVKVDDTALGSDGTADIKKVMPLVFTPNTQSYYGIGSFAGHAFSIGERV